MNAKTEFVNNQTCDVSAEVIVLVAGEEPTLFAVGTPADGARSHCVRAAAA